MADEMDPSPWIVLCGNLAPIASLVVGVSPWPTIQTIRSEKKIGSLPLLPYTSMVVNSILFFSYGLLLHEFRIWSCNGLGLILGIYYFVHFIKYAPPSSPTLPGTVLSHIQAIFVTLICTVLAMLTLVDPTYIIGKVGFFITILLFGSPLTVIRVVLETRSAKAIPLPFTLSCIVNCFCWTVFGLGEKNDVNIYGPNSIGLVFALIQLGLKLHFDDNVLGEFSRELTRSNSKPEALPYTSVAAEPAQT